MLKSVLSVDMRSHSWILGMAEVLRFWFGFSFPKIEVLVAIANAVLLKIPQRCLCQGYAVKTGLIQQSNRGYFQATIP
ncbi:hypothetical protein QUA79_28145 [Microcoleus sp. F8-D1]|uniref:hypothetical protein n=2 Tax=Phormidium nigroviride TaxID=482564 RepID=UPI00123748CA|nr:hypothetical protein [Oscillatoria nigro-viridis]